MRVIGGEFRSRRLKTVPGLDTRPTPGRLRETLFDILRPRIAGARFVDAYAGTGAVGIEALSRGAAHVVFLEKSRKAVEVIRQNVLSLGLADRVTIVAGPVVQALPRYPAGIVFLDPPYEQESEYTAALEVLGESPPPLAVVQHSSRCELPESAGALRRRRVLKQGDNVLSFFAPAVY